MRIAANSVVFPSYIVPNDEIGALVRRHTSNSAMAPRASAFVERYLQDLGASTRHWLSASEKPIDLIEQTYAIALERAGISPKQIDALIYCSVDRAVVEPANAALVASRLGLPTVRAFDISHACSGWFTALQTAGDRADFHGETSLIISAEFPLSSGATYPKNFDLSDLSRSKWKLATFVLGEAAGATIVTPGGSSLKYQQRSDNDGYRASYVLMPNGSRFLSRSIPDFEVPEMTFYSHPYALTKYGSTIAADSFEALGVSVTDDIVVIPHTISSKLVNMFRARYSKNLTVLDIFPQYGNIGTLSLPAGLNSIERDVAIRRRNQPNRIVGWMLGAGMSSVSFEFPLANKAD
jgi:3-oxoacyl-[acyl-carrier-protein] synthase-3